MSTFSLHKTVIKQIDKYRKHCLWRGVDINAKKKPHQNQHGRWSVCQKNEGGLGVLNLRAQNDALLLKHLHKFFNRMDIHWVQLIWGDIIAMVPCPVLGKRVFFLWRDILKLLDSFKGLAMVNIKDGISCLFLG